FRELAAIEPGTAMPRLYAAQTEACAPLVLALASGAAVPSGVEPGATLAEGIKIGRPIRGRELLEALRTSRGGARAVGEPEIAASGPGAAGRPGAGAGGHGGRGAAAGRVSGRCRLELRSAGPDAGRAGPARDLALDGLVAAAPGLLGRPVRHAVRLLAHGPA